MFFYGLNAGVIMKHVFGLCRARFRMAKVAFWFVSIASIATIFDLESF